MLRTVREITTYNFSGGINVSQSPHLIRDSELYIDRCTLEGTYNVVWDSEGITKRLGTTAVTATALAGSVIVAGVLHVGSTTGVETIVIAAWDTAAGKVKFYKWSGTAWTVIADATTAITATTASIRMLCHADALYIVSGVTPPKKLTSLSTMSEFTIAAGVYPSLVTYHKGRLWFIQSSSIFASELEASGSGWDTSYGAWVFNTGAKDGDVIAGLCPLGDSLYAFKRNSIYRMDGDNYRNWLLVKDGNDLGCGTGDTIQSIGNAIMYLGYDGCVRLYDGTDSTVVSGKIQPFLDASPHRDCADAYFDGRYYRLALCTSGTANTLEFLFDTRHAASRPWWIHRGRTVGSYFGSLDRQRIYYVDTATARIQQLDTGTTDNGATITASVQSKYMVAGEPNRTKQWDTLLIDFDSNCGDVALTIRKEDALPLSVSSFISFIDDDAYMSAGFMGASYSDSSTIQFKKQTHRIRFPSRMDGFSLSITMTSVSSSFVFLGWTLLYRYKPI